jgi:Uma2 family endonuclease
VTRAHDQDPGYTVTGYFQLVEKGYLEAGDRVELLEGLVVASPPPGPLHASIMMRVERALRLAIGERASLRVQMPLVAGTWSAPEPDIAVVPGVTEDYEKSHPTRALLVVEISDSSLPQDRLTKSRIYARAGIPEYWILNLREHALEVRRQPDPEARLYASVEKLEAGDVVELVALPGSRRGEGAIYRPSPAVVESAGREIWELCFCRELTTRRCASHRASFDFVPRPLGRIGSVVRASSQRWCQTR